MTAATRISALRVDELGRGHFYTTRELDAGRVERFVALAERQGLLTATHGSMLDDSYAVLDLIDDNGDIIDDRHIPNEQAWNALNSELRLAVEVIE